MLRPDDRVVVFRSVGVRAITRVQEDHGRTLRSRLLGEAANGAGAPFAR